MGILSWVLLGLVVGALAKCLMPGDDPGGFVVTLLLGIAGAFACGFLGSLIGIGTAGGFSLRNIAVATGGVVLPLYGYRKSSSR